MAMVRVVEGAWLPRCRHLTAAAPLIGDAYAVALQGAGRVTVLNVFPLGMAPTQPRIAAPAGSTAAGLLVLADHRPRPRPPAVPPGDGPDDRASTLEIRGGEPLGPRRDGWTMARELGIAERVQHAARGAAPGDGAAGCRLRPRPVAGDRRQREPQALPDQQDLHLSAGRRAGAAERYAGAARAGARPGRSGGAGARCPIRRPSLRRSTGLRPGSTSAARGGAATRAASATTGRSRRPRCWLRGAASVRGRCGMTTLKQRLGAADPAAAGQSGCSGLSGVELNAMTVRLLQSHPSRLHRPTARPAAADRHAGQCRLRTVRAGRLGQSRSFPGARRDAARRLPPRPAARRRRGPRHPCRALFRAS